MDSGLEAPAIISNALLQNVLERLAFVEAIIEGQKTLFEAHEALIAAQKVEIEAQRIEIAAQKTQIEQLPAGGSSKSEPKVADPEPFNGNRLQLQNFLAKCRLKFAAQPSMFRNDKAKVFYAGSRLADPAFSWFQPFLAAAEDPEQETPVEATSFEAFATSLTNVYGDPNLEASSARAIKALKQTTSAAQYMAEFKRLRQYIKWNESALRDQYYEGLKDTVKDEVACVGRPSTLTELENLAIRFDARMYERLLEKRQAQPQAPGPRNTLYLKPTPMTRNPSQSSTSSGFIPTPSRTPSPAAGPSTALATPAFTQDGTVPMELDANGRWHLAASEKLRRKQLRLCDYCGADNHNVFNCPDKPASNQPKLPRFARQMEISLEVTPPEDSPKDHTQE